MLFTTGPPFIAAEVLSRATANADRTTKKAGYARAEVELYLIVDPVAKIVEIYRLNGDTYGAAETLSENESWAPAEFAGLNLDLAKLWM